MTPPRRTKPVLDRYEPLRAFSGVFGPPGRGAAPTNGARVDGARAEGPWAPGESNGARASGADGVSRGVDLGYRVVEEYLNQGQAFARSVWPTAALGGAQRPDPQRMMEQMFQYAADFAALWFEYARATMGGTQPAQPAAGLGGEPSRVGPFDIEPPRGSPREPRPAGAAQGDVPRPSETAPQRPPRVVIDVASNRRVQVEVDLKPGAGRTPLSVHALRSRDDSLPRIAGATASGDAGGERVLVHLVVPDDQPPSLYAGLIVDQDSNLPQGALSVRVLDPAAG